MWRLTAFLVKNPSLSRAEFVVKWRELFALIAERQPKDGQLRKLVINLPIVPPSEKMIEFFGDRFDGVGEFWFDSADAAVAVLGELNKDEALRKAAKNTIDHSQSINWLAEVFPKHEVPGTKIRFFAAGETADGWAVEDAQTYWRDEHWKLATTVEEVAALITQYVQAHGRNIAELKKFDLLGQHKFYPMCATMGFRTVDDMATSYGLPRYLSIIRPDEIKFSKQGEMLAFASEQAVAVVGAPA